MPPVRTIPPAKAIKTERTHEENQERAYIAASRRSDRSLEARVESARRASEIHKRRTGRSLRVTEQDVINEEMYEEEDDDLPMQYRRLTAHLQTGSVDFNRRLAAYLTNQVAMRSAMEQMVNNSYHQQYPNAPQFAQNGSNMFPSPMARPQMMSSPTTSFRQSPYPNPHQQNFRQMHGRAYSTAGVIPSSGGKSPSTPHVPQQSIANRRLSTPASLQSSASQQIDTDAAAQDPDYQRQTQSATFGNFPPLWQDMGPFTTSLPPESMQMLAPALDPNDPFSASLMGGSENYLANSYYPWPSPQQFDAKHGQSMQYNNPFNGMSTTLAPSALDSNTDILSATPKAAPQVKTEKTSAPSSGLDFSFSQETKNLPDFPASGMNRENSQGLASGQITPRDGFWDSFVQDGEWSEEAATG